MQMQSDQANATGAPTPQSLFLSILFALGMYTGAALPVQQFPLPAFVSGFAGLCLLFIHRRRILASHIPLLIAILSIPLPGILAHFQDASATQRISGYVQFAYSITISLAFCIELSTWPRRLLTKFFGTCAAIIFFGCLLELTTGFSAVSNAFRQAAFPVNYDADARDQLIFGRVRPKLFTSEPSYVALFFLLTTSCWYLLSESKKATVTLLLATAGGAFLIGSPIILAAFLLPLAKRQVPLTQTTPAFRLGGKLLFGSISLFLLVAVIIPAALAPRLTLISQGLDESFLVRVVTPPKIAYEVFLETPVFGAGINAKNELDHLVRGILWEYNVTYNINEEYAADGVTNAFWLSWIFLGAAGGLALVLWMLYASSILGNGVVWSPVLATFVCWQGMGGFVDPRTWFFFFMFVLAFSKPLPSSCRS